MGKAFVKKLSVGEAVVVPLYFPAELFMYRKNGRTHLPLSDLSWMLFYRDSLHKIHAEVVTYLPDDAYFQNTAKDKRFSGVVTVMDWQGNFLKGFYYNSSGIRKIISQEEVKADSTMRGTFNEPLMLDELEGPPVCTATDWYTCGLDQYGDYVDCHYSYTEYNCSGGGGGGGGGGTTGSGSPTGDDYSSLPPKPIGNGGGGTAPPDEPPPPNNLHTLIPDDCNDSIYYDDLSAYPCGQQAVEQAENLNANISDLIQSIFGEAVRYNIYYGTDNSLEGTTIDGRTNMLAHYEDVTYSNITRLDININFRPSFLQDATQLAIVTSTLHESIHAYYNYREAIAITDEEKTELESEFKFLQPFDPQHPLSQEEVEAMEHDQMATDYINQIVTALKKYYPISDARYQQLMEYYPYSNLTKDDFYTALAWGGLAKTNAWEAFEQQNPTLAVNYTNIQDAEDFGTEECIANDRKCN